MFKPEELDKFQTIAEGWDRTGLTCYAEEAADMGVEAANTVRAAWNEIAVRTSERDTIRALAAHLQKELDAIKVTLDGYRTTVAALGRELQSHDCTHRDTPGLIHCPIDQPCSLHRIERLREALKVNP